MISDRENIIPAVLIFLSFTCMTFKCRVCYIAEGERRSLEEEEIKSHTLYKYDRDEDHQSFSKKSTTHFKIVAIYFCLKNVAK